MKAGITELNLPPA